MSAVADESIQGHLQSAKRNVFLLAAARPSWALQRP